VRAEPDSRFLRRHPFGEQIGEAIELRVEPPPA
jgi:hypothetical protein